MWGIGCKKNDFVLSAASSKCKYTAKWQEKKQNLDAEHITDFGVLLTVHLNIFTSVINELDAQNFCFTISLFHASTCFEHMCS